MHKMHVIFAKRFWRPILYLIICFNASSAHVRMVCPRPVSPRSDLSTATIEGKSKCLLGDGSSQNIMEVHPGLFTIRFEETKFMAGSPFRVLLITAPSLKEDNEDDYNKRDLKREKRAATDVTTDSSMTIQELIDLVNTTLSSINPHPNDTFGNGTFVDDTSSSSQLSNTDEESAVKTESSTVVESTTGSVSSTPTKIVPEDSNAKGSETEANNQESEKNDDAKEPESTSIVHKGGNDSNIDGDNIDNDKEVEDKGESDNKGGEKGGDTKGGEDIGRGNGKSPSLTQEQEQSCVLLDHVPHNDLIVISDQCSHQSNDFPLGVCHESTYYVTIRIPDIFCPDCFLVVQQVEAKQDHKVCDVNSLDKSECVSYISCSRISIRQSSEGMNRNMSHCSNYIDNLPDDWAYRPQDIYKAGDHAVLTMDLLHQDLHIEIMKGLKIGPTEKLEIRFGQKIIWNATIKRAHINADAVLMVWNHVPLTYQTILKENKLVLNVIGSKKSKAQDILFKHQVFGEGKTSYLHDIFSNHGWLIANRFLGPMAKDPMAALPIGPCVPPARHFITFFEAVEAGDHGLLGMTVMENRAYITVVLHVRLGTVQSIAFRGSQLVGAKDIVVEVPDTFSGIFQVALDVTQQMKFMDTVQFLKTVEVQTNRDDAILVGDLEEGFYTVLRDHKGKVKGMGTFQPTQGYWMRAEIVLSDLSDKDPKIQNARILGSHVELMDLSKETVHCTQKFCCMETYVSELSSEFFLHLLNGQARVEVTTGTDEVSGQITGSHNCTKYGGLCLLTSNLSKDNALTEKYGGTVSAVVLIDRAGVLEISVQVSHPDWDWNVNNYTALLVSQEDHIYVTIPLNFAWIYGEFHSAQATFPMLHSKTLGRSFPHKNKKFHLTIYNGVHVLMYDTFHGLKKKECIQSKIHVVGKDKYFWTPLTPFEPIHAVMLDHLKFMFDGNTTTLYIMKSKHSLEKCDFKKAKELKATSYIGGMSVYFYKLTSSGRFYFGDKNSCGSQNSANLTVYVLKGKDSLVQDGDKEDWCQTSFYASWRQDELQKWEPPSVAGPIVLGLFLGLTTSIGFLLWQGMKMKQMPSHSASSSRNSLSHFVRF